MSRSCFLGDNGDISQMGHIWAKGATNRLAKGLHGSSENPSRTLQTRHEGATNGQGRPRACGEVLPQALPEKGCLSTPANAYHGKCLPSNGRQVYVPPREGRQCGNKRINYFLTENIAHLSFL